MPAPLSAFDGTNFQIHLQGVASPLVQVTPYWPERNDQRLVGSVRSSITGRVSLQEMNRFWLPVTLIFDQQHLPAAFIDQTILNAFTVALQAGGTHTLSLEGTAMTVIFDRTFREPVEVREITPTGEFEATFQGRLYEATVHLRRLFAS
jgi:hypothetical protein